MATIMLCVSGMKPSNLEDIDSCLTANPFVYDEALIDFTLDSAVLQIWVKGSADPTRVCDQLLSSLRSRLGQDPKIEIEVQGGEA